jgi:hypothetical protein
MSPIRASRRRRRSRENLVRDPPANRLTSPAWVRRFLRLARRPPAQVAELVDALVSGTSGAIRGGSSPLLGTNNFFIINKIIVVPAGLRSSGRHRLARLLLCILEDEPCESPYEDCRLLGDARVPADQLFEGVAANIHQCQMSVGWSLQVVPRWPSVKSRITTTCSGPKAPP